MKELVRSTRLEAFVLGLLLWATFMYFAQGGGANQNSRFALTRAIVEQSSLAIDDYASTTFDIARFQGHYYSDKAPGLAFLAVPAHTVYLLFHEAPSEPGEVSAALHWSTAFTVSLCSAVAGGLFYLLLLGRAHSRPAALLTTLGWMLATPAFAYSTLFYGHQLAAALVVMALCVIELRRASPLHFTWGLLLGTLLGTLVAVEYPTLVVVPLLVVYARPFSERRYLLGGTLGFLLVLGALGAYHYRCFGSPFGAGYLTLDAPEFAATMQGGWMGFHPPKLRTIYQLFFGEFRGLLPTAPWLLLASIGVVPLWQKGLRREAWLSALGLVIPGLVVAAFARWDGGAAFGPRHLVYALPLMASPAAVVFDLIPRFQRIWRFALAIGAGFLLLVGMLVCLAAVAVMPEMPEQPVPVQQESFVYLADPKHPLTEFTLPLFLDGRLSTKAAFADGRFGLAYLSPGHDLDAYNLGERWLRLRGHMSLLPLAALWVLASAAWRAISQRGA